MAEQQPVNVTVINKGCLSGCGNGCAWLILIPFLVFAFWWFSKTKTGEPVPAPAPKAAPAANETPASRAIPAPATTQPNPAKATPDAKVIAEAQRRAVIAYPALGVANSPLNLEFLARLKRYQVEKPEMFSDPEWPTKLAEECQRAISSK